MYLGEDFHRLVVTEMVPKVVKHRWLSWAVMPLLCLLTACGGPSPLTTPAPTELTVPTAVLSPTATYVAPAAATRAAYATRNATWRSDLQTQVALTPIPPLPTLPPLRPTPTWSPGWVHCAYGDVREPARYKCWRGIFNGELLTVAAGRQGSLGDRSQGLFMVFHGGILDASAPTTEVYSTPLRLGGMTIVSVNDTRFTLAPYDPLVDPTPNATQTPGISFIFDLATRQWVNP
jgi:hypothetical protein